MQAAAELGLDLSASWFIGDILDDVEAGHRAGCRSLLLDVGNETEWREGPLRIPDARAPDLDAAARRVLAERGRADNARAQALAPSGQAGGG